MEAAPGTTTPITFLGLAELKKRIRDYNLLLALAQINGEEQNHQVPVHLAPPTGHLALIRDKRLLDLRSFKVAFAWGRKAFDWLMERGEIENRVRQDCALFHYRELAAALPSVVLKWKRYRDRYLVSVDYDAMGRIVTIKVYSATWHPLFERRIDWESARNFTAGGEAL